MSWAKWVHCYRYPAFKNQFIAKTLIFLKTWISKGWNRSFQKFVMLCQKRIFHTHKKSKFYFSPQNSLSSFRNCILKPDFKSEHKLMRNEPQHDKTNNMAVRLANTQISLGIRTVWPESSLSAWRKLGPLATHWAHSEDSDQTGRRPRLIWVFAGRTLTLLFLLKYFMEFDP